MPLSPLQNIQREISTHPKEREGFAKSDVENLSPDEIPKAKTLLIHAVSEGALRCNEPLLWLLGTNYEQEISEAYQNGELSDHGSIFLPYVLFKNSRDPIWVEKMKLGIEHGDAAWGMRESALLQLKEISLQVDFVKFCWQLIENDQNNDMKKAAARQIATEQGYDVDSDLRDKISIHVEAISFANGQKYFQGELKLLKKLISYPF